MTIGRAFPLILISHIFLLICLIKPPSLLIARLLSHMDSALLFLRKNIHLKTYRLYQSILVLSNS